MTTTTELVKRRTFLLGAGAAGVAGLTSPLWLGALPGLELLGAATAYTGNTIVVIFLRGGADGLSMVPPVGDPDYAKIRPTIAVPQPAALPLGGPSPSSTFAFHPGAARLSALYDAGKVAIVPAAASSNTSHSHFDAQSFVESGTPDQKGTPDGWLGRYLTTTASSGDHPLRAVAFGSGAPASIRGGPVVSASSFGQLSLISWGPPAAQIEGHVSTLYGRPGIHPILAGTVAPSLATIDDLTSLGSTDLPAGWPTTELGGHLWPIARLLEAGFPIQVAHADMGSWDTHDSMGTQTDVNGRMYLQVSRLDGAIGAFYDRLAAAGIDGRVTTVVMSEFGRRAYENSSGGCDHGHGMPMLVIGGGVSGGVKGPWPTLATGSLDNGDVAMRVDMRHVIAELLADRLSASAANLSTTFPRLSSTSSDWVGVTS